MENAILGLRAETSIHAGTGQNTGVIDLPIQREAHTDYPCVYGSAMKGALRAHAETLGGMGEADVKVIFGPDGQKKGQNPSDHAGAIAITDARLLLLPIRSLTGHFKLVTCPAILKRLERDLKLIGQPKSLSFGNEPEEGRVKAYTAGDKLFLEEFLFQQDDGVPNDLIDELNKFGMEKSALENQLLIMHDDDFRWFAKSGIAITPHIAIDNAKKTVVGGALWYEESLPPDTLLYTLLMASKSRNGGDPPLSDTDVLRNVTGMFSETPYLQIGGNETVGMGWCKVKEVGHE